VGVWETALAATLLAASGIQMAEIASRSEAEAFLSAALPAATAANPSYRTPGTDYSRRWLNKTTAFENNAAGGVVVSTDEIFEDFRNGVRFNQGTHQASFPIDAVAISLESTDDTTESGAKARGVLFKCPDAPCIEATWDGRKSMSGSTDIYIQDPDQRDKIFAAFRALQGKSGSP
jgi:hypothetical protein